MCKFICHSKRTIRHDNRRLCRHNAQEELVKARRAEQDAVNKAMEAQQQRTDAEERLAQAFDDRTTLEDTLRDALGSQDAQAKELRAARDRLSDRFERETCNAASQTVTDEQLSCVEPNLVRSQAEYTLGSADLAFSKKQVAELQQELADSIALASAATTKTRGNEELAIARQKEIVSFTQREQVSLPFSARDICDDVVRTGTYWHYEAIPYGPVRSSPSCDDFILVC